jgi:cytochrome c oxidase subunit 2
MRVKSFAAGCLAAVVFGGATGYFAAAAAGERGARVELAASKFEFSAREIRVRKGHAVTFVLSASDFVHGFSVPDFHVRTDLVPGKAVEVTFTPHKAGRFVFLCDNFCGEGHDHMSGVLVVTE